MRKYPVYCTALFLIICVLLTCTECGKRGKSDRSVVGIMKIVSHPALDAVEKGILDELKEEGFYNLSYDIQNAEGDVLNAASIAGKFEKEHVKIAVGIATPCAQALRKTLKDAVVVYSAVTDPVDAGLVKSLKAGEKKIAGVSDMVPVKDQIMLLKKIKDIKRLGHIYANHEANAVVLARMIKHECFILDIEFVEATVAKTSDVKSAARSIAGRVDAFYLSTDNTVVSAIGDVAEIAKINRIPVMTADPGSSEKWDVLVSWGFDYYKVGIATGKLVARILSGEPPENIPAVLMTEPSDVDLLINLDVAERLGLAVPEKIISQASRIVRKGNVEKK